MNSSLNDNVAWVTGGGSGIGRATAVCLARAGARVAILARSEDELRQTADAIAAVNGESLKISADVRSADEMERAVRKIFDHWGRLDIVIANAGINGMWAPIADLSADEWDETIETNLRGTFLTLKYAIPHLSQRGGAIVITSSINGTRVFSTAGASAYATTKAGQVALAKSAALELAKHRVRVNVVCPGSIDTPILATGRKRNLDEARVPAEFPAGGIPLTGGTPGSAEQVAELILFLVSEAASHVTGSEIWIDGCESLIHG